MSGKILENFNEDIEEKLEEFYLEYGYGRCSIYILNRFLM